MTIVDKNTVVTEQVIRQAINEIKDPCSCVAGVPAGLEEMGLVHNLCMKQGQNGVKVEVSLGITDPTCALGPIFVGAVKKRLRELEGIESAEVMYRPDLVWTEERFTPEYKERVKKSRAIKDPLPLNGIEIQ